MKNGETNIRKDYDFPNKPGRKIMKTKSERTYLMLCRHGSLGESRHSYDTHISNVPANLTASVK